MHDCRADRAAPQRTSCGVRDDRSHLGAPHEHGLEVEKDIGYIRITELQPIIAAVVLEPTTTITFRGGSGVSSHFSFRMIRLYFEA